MLSNTYVIEYDAQIGMILDGELGKNGL